MQTLVRYYKLTRLQEYYGTVLFITALGVFLVRPQQITQIVILLAANFLSTAFAFMINDVEDAQDDAKDAKKRLRNLISAGEIKKTKARAVTYSFAILSIALYSLLGIKILMIGAMGLTLGYCYSSKRIRLKSMPVIDVISHGLFLGLVYFLTAVFLGRQITPLYVTTWLGLVVFLLSALSDINNEIRDFEVDQKSGIKNTLHYFNLKRLKHLQFYIVLLLIANLYLFMIYYASILVGLALLVFGALISAIYYKNWYVRTKNIYLYPYKQEIIAFSAMILFLGI